MRRKYWRDHAAFVLQDYDIIEDELVEFNVRLRRARRGIDHKLNAALEYVGLADRKGEPASHLSGGEKQRLALSRAVYRDAPVLYVDEPTASLDSTNRALVTNLLANFSGSGATVIISTHDEELISVCDQHHRIPSPASLTVP